MALKMPQHSSKRVLGNTFRPVSITDYQLFTPWFIPSHDEASGDTTRKPLAALMRFKMKL